jgi:hypothetical protein
MTHPSDTWFAGDPSMQVPLSYHAIARENRRQHVLSYADATSEPVCRVCGKAGAGLDEACARGIGEGRNLNDRKGENQCHGK